MNPTPVPELERRLHVRRGAVSCAALFLVLIISHLWPIGSMPSRDSSGKAVAGKNAKAQIESQLEASLIDRPITFTGDLSKGQDLRSLLDSWEALNSVTSSGVLTDDHLNLAVESVKRLGISEKLVYLLEFAREKRILGAETLINAEVEKLLRGASSEDARSDLVDLPDKTPGPGPNYRQSWSFYAGNGCDRSELDAFTASLSDLGDRQNAIFGWSVGVAGTEPSEAISETVEQLLLGTRSNMRSQSLERVIRAIPEDVDWDNLEKLLPSDYDVEERGPIRNGRYELFERWAASSPEEAGNYIFKNTSRISPKAIEAVVGIFSRNNPERAFYWVQELPDGEHFDEAVVALSRNIAGHYPKEAQELARFIGDEVSRTEAFERIRHAIAVPEAK